MAAISIGLNVLITYKTKAYWIAHFAMYGFKTLCEISKMPFEISHKKINQNTKKNMHLRVFKILANYVILDYGILSFDERGPCGGMYCNAPIARYQQPLCQIKVCKCSRWLHLR